MAQSYHKNNIKTQLVITFSGFLLLRKGKNGGIDVTNDIKM